MKTNQAHLLAVLVISLPIGLVGAEPAHPPNILVQPADRRVGSGYDVQFSVVVNGTPPFAYQWRHYQMPLLDAVQPTLLLNPVSFAQQGEYDVVVRNAYGAVTSRVARLEVQSNWLPCIVQEPASTEACTGDWAQFVAPATGDAVLLYWWYREGQLLDAPSYDTLNIESVTATDAGDYSVVVSNWHGAVTSAVARLEVDPVLPVIREQPSSQVFLLGYQGTLGVSAYACSPSRYQWRKDGGPLAEGTNQMLIFTPFTASSVGDYDVVVVGAGGCVTSVVATLVATQYPPRITQDLYDQSVTAGSTATFYFGVEAAPPPSFQWFHEGRLLEGEGNAWLNVVALSTNQTGEYQAVARNSSGCVTSAVARLTVFTSLPAFSDQPISQGRAEGEPIQFYASAQGAPPPALQWRFEEEPIPGATNNWLNLLRLTTNQSGHYDCLASNAAGVVASRVATLLVSPLGPLDNWRWRRTTPQGNDLFGVVFGNGVFAAVGRLGTKVTSQDGGATWQFRRDGVADLRAVAFGNGRFVALGTRWFWPDYGPCWIQTSADGLHWNELPLEGVDDPMDHSVAFGNGRFVVNAYNATVVSTNGTVWQKQEQPMSFRKVRFGNGLFIALSLYGPVYTNNSFHEVISLSGNGLNWTNLLANAPGSFADLAFGNGLFVACGAGPNQSGFTRATLFSSPDGVDWTPHVLDLTATLSAITCGGGRFVAVSQSYLPAVVTSEDGVRWTAGPAPAEVDFYEIAYGGERFAAVGNFGNLHTSRDGISWAAVSSSTSTNLRSLARGPDRFVAVGNDGFVLTSEDGVGWVRRATPATNNLRGIAYGNNRFVAVGEGDILVSLEGLNWSRQPLSGDTLYSVTYHGGLFVAVGNNGRIQVSTNGLDWKSVSSPIGTRLNSVTWGGGLFAAVGRYGNVVVSGSGTNWVRRHTGGDYLQGVTYGNDRFVAAGQSGFGLVSTNGLDWAVSEGLMRLFDVEDVSFANGRFVAVGGNGQVASSSDGQFWTLHPSGCRNDLRMSVYANSRFWAVGNNETILQSGFAGPPVLKVRSLEGSGEFEFVVTGEEGAWYRLQASTDLADWEDLMTFRSEQETTLFLDEDTWLFPQRFYRVVTP